MLFTVRWNWVIASLRPTRSKIVMESLDDVDGSELLDAAQAVFDLFGTHAYKAQVGTDVYLKSVATQVVEFDQDAALRWYLKPISIAWTSVGAKIDGTGAGGSNSPQVTVVRNAYAASAGPRHRNHTNFPAPLDSQVDGAGVVDSDTLDACFDYVDDSIAAVVSATPSGTTVGEVVANFFDQAAEPVALAQMQTYTRTLRKRLTG